MIVDNDLSPISPQINTISVCLNGTDQTRTCKINYLKVLKMETIIKRLAHFYGRSFHRLRLFTSEGVEIYQDDLQFTKNGTLFYATDGIVIEPNLGQEFDQSTSFSIYQIIRQLGEGGFGKVLLGRHKLTNETVAIKIIDTCKIGNAQDIDMVFREAELMKSLRHKNIVKIMNCYTLPNMQVVIIMEYLQGGELLEYLEERGKLPEDEARYFFLQIAEAIYYCHNQKLIHRDLKLENIILQSKQNRIVKIVDFGIAGMATNLNVDKMDVGSLGYMAPEVLSGRAQKLGPSIDVWALGVILFGLVCGQLPFNRDKQADTVDAIITGEYAFPKDVNPSAMLRDLIQRQPHQSILPRIFIVDSDERIKMLKILNHPWMKQPLDPNKFNNMSFLLSPGKKQITMNLIKGINHHQGKTKSPNHRKELTQSVQLRPLLKTTTTSLQLGPRIQKVTISPPDESPSQRTSMQIFKNNLTPQSSLKAKLFQASSMQWDDCRPTIPLISVIEHDANEIQPDEKPIDNSVEIVGSTRLVQVPSNHKLITKDYNLVLEKYKGKCKTFRCNLAQILGQQEPNPTTPKIIKSTQSQQTMTQQTKSTSFLNIPAHKHSISLRQSYHYQMKNKIQTRLSKKSNFVPLLNTQISTVLTQIESPKQRLMASQSGDLDIPQANRWLNRLEQMKRSTRYLIESNFMERKKNQDQLFNQTFRNYLKQAKKDNLLHINELYSIF